MMDMPPRVKKVLEQHKASMRKLQWIVDQCIEHDRAWWEVVQRLQDTIKTETRYLKNMNKPIRLRRWSPWLTAYTSGCITVAIGSWVVYWILTYIVDR